MICTVRGDITKIENAEETRVKSVQSITLNMTAGEGILLVIEQYRNGGEENEEISTTGNGNN